MDVSGSASPHLGFPQDMPSVRNGKAEKKRERKRLLITSSGDQDLASGCRYPKFSETGHNESP